MAARRFNNKGLTLLGLIIIIAIILVVIVILLTLYNFNYNLFFKNVFKYDIQSNLNNASKIIVKELRHSNEIEINDDSSKMNFRNLNEGSIYLEKNIIKMKKGRKEENLTDINICIVEELKFENQDNIVTIKIKGKHQNKNLKNKEKYLKEYIVQLKIETLISK